MIAALAAKALAWILGRPTVAVALAAGLVIAITAGIYQVKLWSERADRAAVELRLADEMKNSAVLSRQLGEMTGNRDRLAAAIEAQNDAVDRLRSAADAAGKAAALTAVRSLQQSEAARRRSDALAGSGPGVMNQWLGDTFGPR